MSFFVTKTVDGDQVSLFQLKERKDFFAFKRAPYRRSVALLKVISQYCHSAATYTPTDLEIARALISEQSYSKEKELKIWAFVMADYVDNYLLKFITTDNARRFKSKITYVAIDFEYLTYAIETIVRKYSLPPFYPCSAHKGRLYPQDVLMASKSLFYLEKTKRIEDLWNSDLIPASVMYIRLYVDELLKNYIPYKCLKNAAGSTVEKTGVRRLFIEDEIKKRNKKQSSVLLDDGEILYYVYKWSCNSVHYGALGIDCLTDWILMKLGRFTSIFTTPSAMQGAFDSYVQSKYDKDGIYVEW